MLFNDTHYLRLCRVEWQDDSKQDGQSMYKRSIEERSRSHCWRAEARVGTYFECMSVKAIPLQTWRGPEGSRRLRRPDFKTVAT